MLPQSLQWLNRSDGGRSWLRSLRRLVDECKANWGLRLGVPYPNSYVSLAVPVQLPDGIAAVLKIQFPHRESEHEAQALARWDGDGAVRLLDHDPVRHALLIERCEPGTHLSDAEKAIEILSSLLSRLCKPADETFASLAEEAALWIEESPIMWEQAGRPFERLLVDAATGALAELAVSQGEQVLLHRDLHADNVHRAQREPWLAIDPKPLRGEREFSVAPIVRSYELGHSQKLVRARLDRLTDELGLDRERARWWTFAQTLAWAFEDDEVLPRHVETARWLLPPV